MRIKPYVFGLLLFGIAGCQSGGESVKLRFDPPAGDQHKNNINMEAVSTLRLFTQIEFKLSLNAYLLQNVDKASKHDHTWVELHLENVKLDFGMDQKLFPQENLKNQGDQVDEKAHELIEQYEKESLRVEYSALGEVRQKEPKIITITDQNQDSLEQAAMNLQRLLGDNVLERLAAFQPYFPQKSIRVGEKWTAVSTQEVLGLPVELTSEYTLASRSGGKATLSINGTYAMDTAKLEGQKITLPFEGLSLPNSDQIKFLLKGGQKGEVIVEEETGWIQESTLEQQILMEFRVGALTIPVMVLNNIRISQE